MDTCFATHSSTLCFAITVGLISRNSANSRPSAYPSLRNVYQNGSSQYNLSRLEESRIYLFPTNPQPNALLSSMQLLLSQKKHLLNVTQYFRIVDKKTNINHLKKLDAALFSLDVVINSEIKNIERKQADVETLSEDEKLDPIAEVSMVCLLSAWKQTLNLIGRMKIENKTIGIEQQIEDIKKMVDIATVELQLYERIQEDRLIGNDKNVTSLKDTDS